RRCNKCASVRRCGSECPRRRHRRLPAPGRPPRWNRGLAAGADRGWRQRVTELATPALADGSGDIDRAAADLAARLPSQLAPLARLAYNYAWSWWPGGDDVFRMIDPVRWEASNNNPIRLLDETSSAT